MPRVAANPERPFVRKQDLPPTFGEKRPCAEPGCITRLHRFHEGDYCYQHEKRPHFVMLDNAGQLRELMKEPKS